MRTLKKSLALVLVVAMAVSLLSVGAFASTSGFTDASSVGATYKEAVDLLTGIGVVSGTTTTTLEPTGNYTREQAAKVICYISLGKTASDALVTGAAPFKDVAADRWSAGYIAYCVSQGIINGNGDGTFNPTGALTGYAWAKLLLTALGNGQDGTYTGSSWQIAVAKDALPMGIFKNDTAAATSATISRQQAMLLGYNALFLPTTKVVYTWDGGVRHISDTKSGSSFAYSIYGYTGQSTIAVKAQLYYGQSATTPDSDTLARKAVSVNGADGYQWYYKNTTTPVTGFYTTETSIGANTSGKALATQVTYSTSNSYFTAYLSSDSATVPTKYYSNGTQLTTPTAAPAGTVAVKGVSYYNNADLAAAHLVNVAVGASVVGYYSIYETAAEKIGYGTTVTYVDTDSDTSTAEKVYISNYAVGVVKAAPVTYTGSADGKTYIYINLSKIAGIGVATGSTTGLVLASDVTGYSGLVAGDVVTVATNVDSVNSKTNYVITKAATFTGTATASTSTTMTIGGTVYTASKNANSATFSQGFLNSVAFYTDANGFLIYASAVTSATTSYAYIIQNGTYSSSLTASSTNQSYVVFSDGTTATITVASKDSAKFSDGLMGYPTVGKAYSYTKNTDGTYALATPDSSNVVTSAAVSGLTDSNGVLDTGVSAIKVGTTAVATADAGTIYVVRSIKTAPIASGNTIDTLATGKAATTNTAAFTATNPAVTDNPTYGTTYNSTWTVYTGYTNAPAVKNAYLTAVKGSDGYADVVFVNTYFGNGTTPSSAFYLLDTAPTAVYKSSNQVDYYTFSAIVDGVKTVVKATAYANVGVYVSGSTTSSQYGILKSKFAGFYSAIPAGTLCTVVYDSNGYVTPGSVSPITAATITYDAANSNEMNGSYVAGTGITSASNGLVTIGGIGYSYTASTYVFYISADKSTVTPGLVDSISDNTTAVVTAATNAATVVNAGGKPTTTQQNSLYAIFIQLV